MFLLQKEEKGKVVNRLRTLLGSVLTGSMDQIAEAVAFDDLFRNPDAPVKNSCETHLRSLIDGLSSLSDRMVATQCLDRLVLGNLYQHSRALFKEVKVESFYTLTSHVAEGVVNTLSRKLNQEYTAVLPSLQEQQGKNICYTLGDQQFDAFAIAVSSLVNSPDLDVIRQTLLVRYLYGKCLSMFAYTKDRDCFISGRRNITHKYLTSVRDYLHPLFLESRDTQVGIHELMGQSGIGKSRAISNLRYTVHALVPHIPCGDVVYTRANDYWWNGYHGQPIILYDDFTHVSAKKLKFDLNFELIALASGTFQTVPMAFEKDMSFTSCVAYLTSNIPLLDRRGVAEETRAALARRVETKTYEPLREAYDSASMSYKFTGFIESAIVAGKRNPRHYFLSMMEAFVREDEFEIQIKDSRSLTPKLTSSVPESHSAIIGVKGSRRKPAVGFGHVKTCAQVNPKCEDTTDVIGPQCGPVSPTKRKRRGKSRR